LQPPKLYTLASTLGVKNSEGGWYAKEKMGRCRIGGWVKPSRGFGGKNGEMGSDKIKDKRQRTKGKRKKEKGKSGSGERRGNQLLVIGNKE
jgi:hypothetical protein